MYHNMPKFYQWVIVVNVDTCTLICAIILPFVNRLPLLPMQLPQGNNKLQKTLELITLLSSILEWNVNILVLGNLLIAHIISVVVLDLLNTEGPN
jgi:hypothetical protein